MTEQLITQLNIKNPDDFYEELIALHDGLSDSESVKLNAKLIMILANHVGDRRILTDALQLAKNSYQKIERR